MMSEISLEQFDAEAFDVDALVDHLAREHTVGELTALREQIDHELDQLAGRIPQAQSKVREQVVHVVSTYGDEEAAEDASHRVAEGLHSPALNAALGALEEAAEEATDQRWHVALKGRLRHVQRLVRELYAMMDQRGELKQRRHAVERAQRRVREEALQVPYVNPFEGKPRAYDYCERIIDAYAERSKGGKPMHQMKHLWNEVGPDYENVGQSVRRVLRDAGKEYESGNPTSFVLAVKEAVEEYEAFLNRDS